jgi:AraC-like DNA-binding protein
VVFKTIAEEILPELRRSRLILTTDLIGKSDEEIAVLAKNDPAALSVEELLYAATLTNDLSEKVNIYKKAVAQYGNDYRTHNNLGMVYFSQGNVAEARRCYAKALQLAPNNADVNYNAGIAAMAENDLAKAEEHLGKSAGTQGDLNAAMGTLYTMKGDYNAAKNAYGNKASNNAAVQHILNEDYANYTAMVQIYHAMDYVLKNYAEDISAKECAMEVGMSYAYFSHMFKKILGKSFVQYLTEVRINHAEKELIISDKSITQIAGECGFNNVSYFIAKYKELRGKTPHHYRNNT